MKQIKAILPVLFLLGVSQTAFAVCEKVTSVSVLSSAAISAGYTAANWEGSPNGSSSANIGLPSVITLSSSNFQPSGMLLASTSLSFLTQSHQTPFSARQVLFKCSVSDAGSLYEMYATNGAWNTTGGEATSEVPGAYYSYVKNVAFRITNTKTGNHYSRYWQARQLTADDWYSDGTSIYIPAGAFSDVMLELFRIDSTNPPGSMQPNGDQIYLYTDSRPYGFIAFKGPGLASDSLTAGADSASVFGGWYTLWPAPWGISNAGITFVRGAGCQVYDYPNVVILPTTTVSTLAGGGSSQANFTVSIECEIGAVSGTSSSTITSSNVAMGFMVNQPVAVNAAMSLGLTTPGGGLTWLLDNNYGASNVASGVGIRIYGNGGQALNLLPDLTSFGTGNSRGWYGFQDITSLSSSGSSSNIYTGDFTASLEAISGQTVTAGTVNSQLQVVVSFQ